MKAITVVYQVLIITLVSLRSDDSLGFIQPWWDSDDIQPTHIIYLKYVGRSHYQLLYPSQPSKKAQPWPTPAPAPFIPPCQPDHPLPPPTSSESADPEDEDQYPDLYAIQARNKEAQVCHPAPPALFFCPEPGCRKSYLSSRRLDGHISLGNHDYTPDKVSLLDKALNLYGDLIEQKDLRPLPLCGEDGPIRMTVPEHDTPLAAGWALQQPAKRVTFTDAQKSFLRRVFWEGERTRYISLLIGIIRILYKNFQKEG